MKLFVLFLFFWCSAFFVLLVVQADPSVSLSPMLEKEQQALYSTIQGFVGNWWNGSDLYPDPCGWTPIQVLIRVLTYYSINYNVFKLNPLL